MPVQAGPGDPPEITAAGLMFEAFQSARSGLFNLAARVAGSDKRMRVNYQNDGGIPYGNPVVVESHESQGFLRETANVALDVLSIAPTVPGNPKALSTPLLAAKTTNPTGAIKHIFGQNGVQTASQTVWKSKGSKARIDIENANPGVRAGNIHYQDANNVKYMYDKGSSSFYGKNSKTGAFDVPAPKSVNNLLQNESFSNGINKGLRYLGEQ